MTTQSAAEELTPDADLIEAIRRIENPAWQILGLCAQQPNYQVYTPTSNNSPTQAYAERVCQGCPVIAQCLAFGLHKQFSTGVFGGMGLREQNKIRRDPERLRQVIIEGGQAELARLTEERLARSRQDNDKPRPRRSRAA